ncbi:DUF1572 family protein [Virgibacillus kekensis]|uniref:DUF1572 family protein n=1 Tax=Virgibacillus kekensis TaxID=202261 RepID=A0ABV9DLG5_9BACI
MNVSTEYLRIVKDRFKTIQNQGKKAIDQLSEDDLRWQPNKESNSVAIIVKHLYGNMLSRWTDFLTSDGEKPTRNRDDEFVDDILSKAELLSMYEKGWENLFNALNNLEEKDLLNEVYIRSEAHLVIDAIERQLAHYASHIGQIIYIGKQVKGTQWETLSIPKGKSEDYLRDMQRKHKS